MMLLNALKKKPYCNDFHLILIPVLLAIISLKYWYIIFILAIYLLFIIKRYKLIMPIFIILLIISINIITTQINTQNIENGKYEAKIVEIIDDNTYIAKINGINGRITDYNHFLSPGDKILLEIEIVEFDSKSYESDFDYKEYLYSQNIRINAKAKSKEYIKSGFSLSNIKYYYTKYLKTILSKESYEYVSAMVFGENVLEDNIKDSYSILGISHILAISGLHIVMMYNILSFILFKLFKYYKSNIQLTIIIIFVILIGAPASCMRALLFLLLGNLNKKGQNKYTKLDILSISCIFMLIINPYQLFSLGFILSFLASFVLIFSNELITNKNKLIYLYKQYLLIFIFTLPFIININNQISIISLLLSPLLSVVIGYILLPISYILSIFPILDMFMKYIFIFINLYITNLSSFNISINIMSFNIFMFIIYYIFLSFILIALIKKKYLIYSISFYLLYLLAIKSLDYLNPFYKVTFIDVGQGDSILIELPNNKGRILVDAYNSLDYLKSRGISKIDYLILTHSDSDHTGDYIKIMDYFDIEYLLYPKYDKGFTLNYINAKSIDYKNKIKIQNLIIDVLGPINEYDDPNSNSIVLKFEIYDTSFMLCGDMTSEEENDLLYYYDNINIDILKVGHHGSDTSSSNAFLNATSPNISIISAGKNNKYGHPHKSVMDRLSKISRVYETSKAGNITVYLSKYKIWISTYR